MYDWSTKAFDQNSTCKIKIPEPKLVRNSQILLQTLLLCSGNYQDRIQLYLQQAHLVIVKNLPMVYKGYLLHQSECISIGNNYLILFNKCNKL